MAAQLFDPNNGDVTTPRLEGFIWSAGIGDIKVADLTNGQAVYDTATGLDVAYSQGGGESSSALLAAMIV